jgi:hypothetical protein
MATLNLPGSLSIKHHSSSPDIIKTRFVSYIKCTRVLYFFTLKQRVGTNGGASIATKTTNTKDDDNGRDNNSNDK